MWCLIFLTILLSVDTAIAEELQHISVSGLDFTPSIDGDIGEWPANRYIDIAISPTFSDDEKNNTGELIVKVAIGHRNGVMYLAAMWLDSTESVEYKPWQWRGGQYRRSKKLDDMFAIRFDMTGDYDRSMIAEKNYETDVWLWSAGRSNPINLATDYKHVISTETMEGAAEHKSPSGKLIYIAKQKDSGSIGYRNSRPDIKNKTNSTIPGITFEGESSGSIADVSAKAKWNSGLWILEMSRQLDTQNPDDVKFEIGKAIQGQIAVFNNSNSWHKSISEVLVFSLSK